MFLYFIGNSFVIFAIASGLFGLAMSFYTGTNSSILYDTLIDLKKESEFKKYNGRSVLYSNFFNGIFLLAIPLIYQFNIKLPFLIGTSFYASSFILAILLIEPPIKRKI